MYITDATLSLLQSVDSLVFSMLLTVPTNINTHWLTINESTPSIYLCKQLYLSLLFKLLTFQDLPSSNSVTVFSPTYIQHFDNVCVCNRHHSLVTFYEFLTPNLVSLWWPLSYLLLRQTINFRWQMDTNVHAHKRVQVCKCVLIHINIRIHTKNPI